jgi:endoglycosylceramidase
MPVRHLAVLAAVSLAACGPAKPAPASKAFTVSAGFIRDPDGRVVVLRGANVSGRNKTPPYFDFHGPQDWQRMRDEWGMNAVRFLVEWAAVEPRQGEFDDTYLVGVAERVRAATDAGLLVFLDMHQDLYGEGFPGGNGAPAWTCDAANYAAYTPQTPWFFGYLTPQVEACVDGFWKSSALQAEYLAAWRRVAHAVVGIDGVLGVDPMNEPAWGTTPTDVFEERRLGPFEAQVIAAVRGELPDALLFAEPAASRNLGLSSQLKNLGVSGVVYAPHEYDGTAEQGLGFSADRRQGVLDAVTALQAEAATLDAALVLGEYGAMASTPGVPEYMDAVYAGAGAHAAGAMVWTYSADEGYGLLDSKMQPKTAYLAGVARPYPERVAGTPESYAFDAATTTFTLRYAADAKVSAPTLISIPIATWAAQPKVDCGGCRYTWLEHQLRIDAPAAGATQTVTLSPP